LAEQNAAEAERFCLDIIDATHEYAAAYKPNIAFFEVFGAEGFSALKNVINAIPVTIPIILDSKRGDIDTTAQVNRLKYRRVIKLLYLLRLMHLRLSIISQLMLSRSILTWDMMEFSLLSLDNLLIKEHFYFVKPQIRLLRHV
jgi:hypothetical protein